MTETPFYLPIGGQSLFAFLHMPDAPTARAFVFCHAMAEEKLWTHRVLANFARQLAAGGAAVLRFDFRGSGDSDGDFSEASVASGLEDLRIAIDELKRRTGVATVDLLGLRFGATMAALAAESWDDVGRLVLWAPIVDCGRYMQELLRSNLAVQTAMYREVRHDRAELIEFLKRGETVNVDGYELSLPMYEQVVALKLGEQKRHPGASLIVQVDRQTGRPAPELEHLASTYPRGTFVQVQEEPFWKEIVRSYLQSAPNLFAATSDWLQDTAR